MRTRLYRARGLPDWPLRVGWGTAILLAILLPILLGLGLGFR